MSNSSKLSFGVIENQALAERISERLLSLISEKQLRPGDKLPPERDLAAMMQVSRPSLREALRALSIMGVVNIRQGSGTYVSSLRPERMVERFEFIFYLDDATFLQLLEARKTIEVGLAALAAERITDEEIRDLETSLERALASVDDHRAFLQADLVLHQQIAAAARNPTLARFMASISQVGLASRQRTVDIPGVPEQVVDDHRAIIEALKRHDPTAAQQAMGRHLDNIKGRLAASSNQ
jgi:GntR family transcriptional regulator, transcriptional repressor for pyruvate dehydrogenase complex